jgi:hypothetical protein
MKSIDHPEELTLQRASGQAPRLIDFPMALVVDEETDHLPLTSFAGEVDVVDACWSNCVEVGAPGIRRMFDRLDTAAADLEGNAEARLAIRDVVRDYRAGVRTLAQAHWVVQSVLAKLNA